MRKTTMPGFTAALSLTKTSHRYSFAQVWPADRGVTGLVPSLLIPPRAPDCPWPCRVINHTCVCPFG
jgi:hypothetical protein